MTLISADNTGFYIPESRRNLIKQLIGFLAQGHVAVIEGTEGIGKTVLIEEVLTSAYEGANKSYVTAAKQLSDVQLRSRIIEQLFGNVLFDPEMPLLTSFIEFNEDEVMLIAIDNAHFLSGRIIGELLQLVSEAKQLGMRLHLILSYNKAINSTLANIKSGLIKTVTTAPLNRTESYQLMGHYIDNLPPATDAKVKRYLDYAKGVPIQLLAFGSEVPQQQDAEQASPLNVKLWGAIVITASLILALALYFYRLSVAEPEWLPDTNSNQPVINAAKEAQIAAQESSELKIESIAEQPEPAQVVVRPSASANQILTDLLKQPSNVSNPTSAQIEQKMLAAKEGDSQASQDIPVSEVTVEGQQAQSTPNTTLSKSSESITPTVIETNPAVENTVSKQAPEPEPPQQPAEQAANKATTPTPSSDLIDSVFAQQDAFPGISATANEVVEPSTVASAYHIDNQQFYALPKNKYVLQLTAVSSEPVLAEYLDGLTVAKDKLRIYKIKRNNNDWIVVTYGLFDSIDLARDEANRVAPTAWAKSVSVIQQQIINFSREIEE